MTRPIPNNATPRAVPFRRLRSVEGAARQGDRAAMPQPTPTLFNFEESDRDDLDRHLIRLVRGAYSAPPGTLLRQKLLTELLRTITDRLWQERSPAMADALHHALHYISRNLNRVAAHEWQTGVYASFIDGLEADCRAFQATHAASSEQRDTRAGRARSGRDDRAGDDGGDRDFGDDELGDDDLGDALRLRMEAVLVYITADPWGDWNRIHLPGRPDVTGQLVTLQRLQHQAEWEAIARHFEVSPRHLAAFFQRQCVPKLRQLPL